MEPAVGVTFGVSAGFRSAGIAVGEFAARERLELADRLGPCLRDRFRFRGVRPTSFTRAASPMRTTIAIRSGAKVSVVCLMSCWCDTVVGVGGAGAVVAPAT